MHQAYPYSDPWSLTWPYRRSIILQELNDTQGDILCLQEVQADHYSQSLLPMLSELGYDGVFKQKTRESMGQYGKVDGCAIFWRKSKFSLTENYSLEFNEIVKRNAGQLGLEDSEKHRSVFFLICPVSHLPSSCLPLQIYQSPLQRQRRSDRCFGSFSSSSATATSEISFCEPHLCCEHSPLLQPHSPRHQALADHHAAQGDRALHPLAGHGPRGLRRLQLGARLGSVPIPLSRRCQ
jgi:hypothetical protein